MLTTKKKYYQLKHRIREATYELKVLRTPSDMEIIKLATVRYNSQRCLDLVIQFRNYDMAFNSPEARIY
jgi:hypothetical protein